MNVNSETGRQAIESVADRIANFLVFKEIIRLVHSLLLFSFFMTVFYFIYKAIRYLIEANKFNESLGKLDLEDDDQRKTYERIMKSGQVDTKVKTSI